MVGEDEDGCVIRRVFAPPAFPGVVGPGSTNGAEHVSTQNPGSDIGETAGGKVVIDAGCAAVTSMDSLKCFGGEEPLVQGESADAERVGEVLMGAGAVAVEGEGEALDS